MIKEMSFNDNSVFNSGERFVQQSRIIFPDHTYSNAVFANFVVKRAGCLSLFVFLVSCNCYSFVALPHGEVGCSCIV